ncbi:MAG TPA: UvrD-helicase domain-containing protein [Thermoanaerobaculia bacterium]
MSASQRSFAFEVAPKRPPARANLVIEAGAGTGKTTAIVAEVLSLMLEREDLAPERIVLMTFTEKAAGEIADRIRGALEDLRARLDAAITAGPVVWPEGSASPLVIIKDLERARRLIAHHLQEIDAIRSQTIHSFCQSLLRSYPIEAGLDPQFKIVEGFERSLLLGQIYDAWLDHETRTDPQTEHVAEWEQLFEHAGYLFQVRELVLALVNRRDLLGETAYAFGELAEAEGMIRDAIHAVRRCDETGDSDVQRVLEYLRATDPPPEQLTEGARLDAWIDYLRPVAPLLREANLPKRGVLKEAIRLLRSEKKGTSIYDRLVSHRAAMALIAMTRRFIAWLDEEKRALGVVDFDDLLLRTLALLDDPIVLARARAQFDYIFVDEFQDTDRTQARIIDRLARDEGGNWVPGRTVIVGDPKQSIYGFRRADPETYYRMTEQMIAAGAERRVIREQYRSDPPLLAMLNAMFSRLFASPDDPEPHDPNVFRPSYHPLIAARGSSRRTLDTPLTILQTQAEDRTGRFFAEGETIARWIHARRDGGPRDLQRFAVLFRRLTKLDDYLDALDRHGIDYVLPPTRSFLDRAAPVDLLAVLRAIAYPFDRGAQISAARSPYFALTDLEILEGGTTTSQDSDCTDPWTRFTSAIVQMAAESRHLTVAGLMDYVIGESGIEAVYAAGPDAGRHLRHLEHIRQIAFEYDLRAGGSVRQFVDEITRRRSEPEEMEPTLLDDSQNAVRIMTVHAAKGLEFETVIMPDLEFAAGGGDAVQLFTVEEPKSLVLSGRAESISAGFRLAEGEPLRKIASRREDAEMRRLFYVGVTRAMTDVVFVTSLSDQTKASGFLKCLYESLGVDRAELMTMIPAEGRELRETPIGTIAVERSTAVEGAAAELHDAADSTTAPQARSIRRRRLLDAELERDLAAGPLVPDAISLPAAVAERLSPSELASRRLGAKHRAAGLLLHRFLELWNGTDEVEPLLRQIAVEAAAEPDVVSRVRRRVTAVTRSPVFQRILQAETIGREFPIRFIEEGTPVERRIDRLIRENGGEIVVDYKSGKPAAARLVRDREQIERYCRAIREITGRPCEGLIWYIDLENDVVVEVQA